MSGDAPSAAKDLQEQFVRAVASELPRNWTDFKIHYENYTSKYGRMEKFTCAYVVQQVRESDFSPSLDAIDLLVELQRAMTGAQGDGWTYLECSLEASGKYSFEFFHGVPPLAAESIRIAEEG